MKRYIKLDKKSQKVWRDQIERAQSINADSWLKTQEREIKKSILNYQKKDFK